MDNREYDAFARLVDGVLAVPHSVMQRRLEDYREESEKRAKRPGPKPKVKTSASGPASRAKD